MISNFGSLHFIFVFHEYKSKNIHFIGNTHFGKCDPVSKYEKLALLGSGTYGNVYKARDKNTNEICALKQIKFYNEVDV